MQPRSDAALTEIRDVLLETYAVNDAMNQLLLEHLHPLAWRAPMPALRVQPGTESGTKPGAGPGAKRSGGRTIAAIFAHLHNSRLVWLRDSAPHLKCPAPLDPFRCTMKQAATAHRKSAAQCLRMLEDALAVEAERKVTRFSRGSWTRTWPAGGAMFAYMFAHEAHHRGQIILLAHQLGYRLPVPAAYGIWHWDKLWKQQGFAQRPR